MKAADIDRIVGTAASVVSMGDLMGRANEPGRASWLDLPAMPGVYAACPPDWNDRPFSTVPPAARHAQPADPACLRGKRDRIPEGGPTDILYLGKTVELRNRVRELARFGQGRADNQRGGEWLRQLREIEDAALHMWCLPRGGGAGSAEIANS